MEIRQCMHTHTVHSQGKIDGTTKGMHMYKSGREFSHILITYLCSEEEEEEEGGNC